jgi:hypothetical protein
MTQNTKDLDEPYIRHLLAQLDQVLADRGQAAILYVVGGANIALAHNGRRTTTDIDAVIKQGCDIVFDAAAAVAASEPGLGADWLSAAFTGYTADGGLSWSWFDNKDDDQPSTAYHGRALTVELASPPMMLALKTLAMREKDLPDIYLLMRELGIKTPLELGRNLARFTGPRIFQQQGTPGMYFHIDPEFDYIFANAPDDLRPPPAAPRSGFLARWRRRHQR